MRQEKHLGVRRKVRHTNLSPGHTGAEDVKGRRSSRQVQEPSLNILKTALMATMLVSTAAGAVGQPTSNAPDFSKWASKTLREKGVNDARVVETTYPFYFTFCRKDSLTLWRYDVMSIEQINATQQGKIVKPLTEAQRTVQVETDSASCNAAS